MKLQLVYSVPVYVQVDTETKEVKRVVVQDEDLSFTGKAVTYEGEPYEDDATASALHDAVNTGVEWPAWEFGF